MTYVRAIPPEPIVWLAYAPPGVRSSGAAVFPPEYVQAYLDMGWAVEGPYVLAKQGSS